MPVDHYLEYAQELFNKIYFLAAKSHNRITIFGLHPQRKETRYGYIQVGKDANFESIQKASRFVEKPTEEKIDDLVK